LVNGDSSRQSRPPRLALPASLAAIAVLTLLLYARSASFGFSYYDDDRLLLGPGGALESAAEPWSALGRAYFPRGSQDHAYYRPLTSLSFALDAARSGDDAGGYHVTNVVVHGVAACLVLLLLRRYRYPALVALLAALVFVAHPALTATVAWLPGRDDGLLAIFALTAWLLHPRARAAARPLALAAHALAWLAALCCKEAAVVLPLVLVLEAHLIDGRSLRDALEPRLLGVWAGTFAVYAALRFAVLGSDAGLGSLGEAGLSGSLRALVSGVGELVWPFPPTVLAAPVDMPFWRGLGALAVMGLVGFWSGARRRRLLFAGVLYAVLVLPSLPAMRLLLLDSRLYLPAVALTLFLAELGDRARGTETQRYGALSFAVALLALRVPSALEGFRDRMTFALAAVRASPRSSLAHKNLGVAYHQAGKIELARREYRAALEHDPLEPTVHNNLGVILMAEGRLTEAERELTRELELYPDSAEARRNLALVRGARGVSADPLKP
jgi:tetratricopeptide (TPR) repeat protein